MNRQILETIELHRADAAVELDANKPFRSAGSETGKTAILLVHGFTGSPWEMREIGSHLAGQGHTVLGVRLPGHGTSARDLVRCRYEDWLQVVENGYRQLAADNDQVFGLGLSTGGLLLLAAARSHEFAGLVLLSPYLRLRQFFARWAGMLSRFVPFSNKPDSVADSPFYYRERPLAGVHQINRLTRQLKKGLAEITVPTLVASAAGDLTVDADSAIDLYNLLGSPYREYYRFGKEIPHVLTTSDNPRQEEIFRLATDFIGRLSRDQER